MDVVQQSVQLCIHKCNIKNYIMSQLEEKTLRDVLSGVCDLGYVA